MNGEGREIGKGGSNRQGEGEGGEEEGQLNFRVI